MAYVLILGAFLFFAARLFGGRRTITPRVENARPARPMIATLQREAPETTGAEEPATTPIRAATSVAPSNYLLGGRRADSAPDAMAAMMDMMSGPGLCTPPGS